MARARREPTARPEGRHERGIVLAIVLVMIFALVTAVYAFQHRAIIDTTIAANRLEAAEADALAKGGLRLAEVLLTIVRAQQAAGGGTQGGGDRPGESNAEEAAGGLGGAPPGATDAIWQGIGGVPIQLDEDRLIRIEIEDETAKLNLNALVPPAGVESGGGDLGEGGTDPDAAEPVEDDGEGTEASDEAVEYLTEVLRYVIDGMDAPPEDTNYDPRVIAENILDFMDGNRTAVNGRAEDEYYRRQDPPYLAWNRPLVSVDQIGLVEGVDPLLLEELRHYVTVHPIGGLEGINLNRAEPWVLKLVYAGTSGNMRLIDDRLAEDLYRLRDQGKLACDGSGGDPRCVPLSEVGSGELGNGGLYPPVALPAKPEVFRVTVTAEVAGLERRIEAVYDTRPTDGPLLLSWRRLRGRD